MKQSTFHAIEGFIYLLVTASIIFVIASSVGCDPVTRSHIIPGGTGEGSYSTPVDVSTKDGI